MNFQKSQSANVLKALRKRKQQSMQNGIESLEILRSNIQSYFNDKIDHVMKEFVNSFFHPAIVNIRNNTNENISEQQVQSICKTMLENCLQQQYVKSTSLNQQPSPYGSSRITSATLTIDSDNDGQQTSLLHQALKRKRNDSDIEQQQHINQQLFLTKAANNCFTTGIKASPSSNSSTIGPQKLNLRSSGAAATNTMFTSTPKFVTTRSTSSRLFSASQSSSASSPAISSRPIFHIIQTPKNLVATHVELAQLLSNTTADAAKKNNSGGGVQVLTSNNQVTSSNVVSSTSSSVATDSTVTSTQGELSSTDNTSKS